MRDLPRQLSVEQLTELFEGETPLVKRLAQVEDPLGQGAEEILVALSHEEKVEALNAHPAIGAKRLSPRSAEEQGSDSDPAVLSELAYLNQVYEEKFGFRFVVFVAGRPKREILQVLGERIGRTAEEELETGVGELVAIARDRWTRT
jgi:2-oxo-4-hydroxy-4-carboxy--5-ureidoimidazoline (OHCU) decarboxylase